MLNGSEGNTSNIRYIVSPLQLEEDEHNQFIGKTGQELVTEIIRRGYRSFHSFDTLEQAIEIATHKDKNETGIEGVAVDGYPILRIEIKPLLGKKREPRKLKDDPYSYVQSEIAVEGKEELEQILREMPAKRVALRDFNFKAVHFEHIQNYLGQVQQEDINIATTTPKKANRRDTLPGTPGLRQKNNVTSAKISASVAVDGAPEEQDTLNEIAENVRAIQGDVAGLKNRVDAMEAGRKSLRQLNEDLVLPLANAASVTNTMLVTGSVATVIEQVAAEQDGLQLPPAETAEEPDAVAQRAAAAADANQTGETEQQQQQHQADPVNPAAEPAGDPAIVPPAPAVSFPRRAFNAVFTRKTAEYLGKAALFAGGAAAFWYLGGVPLVTSLIAKAGYTLSANALLGTRLASLALAGLAVEQVGAFATRRVLSAIQNWRRPAAAPVNPEVPAESNTVAVANGRLQDLLAEPNAADQINLDLNNEDGVSAPITHMRDSQQPRPEAVPGQQATRPDADAATPPASPSRRPSIH